MENHRSDDPTKKLSASELKGTDIQHDGVARHLCKVWEGPPGPSNKWATKLEDVWSENGFEETLNLAVREVHVYFCMCTLVLTLSAPRSTPRRI